MTRERCGERDARPALLGCLSGVCVLCGGVWVATNASLMMSRLGRRRRYIAVEVIIYSRGPSFQCDVMGPRLFDIYARGAMQVEGVGVELDVSDGYDEF